MVSDSMEYSSWITQERRKQCKDVYHPFILFNLLRVYAFRGVAQSGSASALGAEGRRFESCHPDN